MFRSILTLLPLAFTLSACADSAAQDRAEAPDLEAQRAAQIEAAQTELAETIDRIGEDFGGSLGIAVVDVQSDWQTDWNGARMLPQQSVSKLWVAFTALRQADTGALDLNQDVTLTRADLAVFYQPIREEILAAGSVTTTVEDLITRAITQSDNTANDAVLNIVGGPEAVRAELADAQLADIRFGPGERAMQSAIAGLEWRQSFAYTRLGFFEARDEVPDSIRAAAFRRYQDDPVDGASALAIAGALARLERGHLLTRERTRWLIQQMIEARSGPNRLRAGAPEGFTLAHKTGTGQFYEGRQSGYNDVGLLYAPDGSAYAIAVMIGETQRATGERMEMMQAVTRAVAAYHAALPPRD